jgi:phenylpyruvate tautomerase PptA (4-oxalocrotonate tautomerase family)
MPLLFLEVPAGLDRAAKAELMAELTTAVDDTYKFPDTRIYLREYPVENVCHDGEVGTHRFRPAAFLEAPELDSVEAKRTMIAALHASIVRWYGDIADADQTLILINQYPLHDAGWIGQLQSDNPMIVEAVAALNA